MNTSSVNHPGSEEVVYEAPVVVYEASLEVRAGSPLSIPDLSVLE